MSTAAGAIFSFTPNDTKNIAKPNTSGVRQMRRNGTPEVRSAEISLSAASRPNASNAPNKHANGNAIGVACGMRAIRKRRIRKTGAPLLMR